VIRRTLSLFAAALVLATGAAQAAETLRITLQLPITTPLGQNLVAFKDHVETASDGELHVEIYPNAQLFTDREVPTAVASGQIEMGVSSLARFAGSIPEVDIFTVPFLFNTPELVRAATAPGSPVRGPLDAAMTAKGARPLWWQPYGMSIMMLRQDEPARLPDDLRGLKIRTFGKALEAFVNTLGGAATNISGSRQYLAYERGTVDGGMTGLLTVADRKLYQVLGSLTLTNHSAIEFIVLINERFWQRLDDSQRTILTEAAQAVETELRNDFAAIEAAALETAIANGMAAHHLSEAELAAWQQATLPLRDAFLAEAEDFGAELLAAAETLTH
jgi:C4-dicarboxylate-binding protein DctP